MATAAIIVIVVTAIVAVGTMVTAADMPMAIQMVPKVGNKAS